MRSILDLLRPSQHLVDRCPNSLSIPSFLRLRFRKTKNSVLSLQQYICPRSVLLSLMFPRPRFRTSIDLQSRVASQPGRSRSISPSASSPSIKLWKISMAWMKSFSKCSILRFNWRSSRAFSASSAILLSESIGLLQYTRTKST